jgi:hypothetical protein
MPPPPGLFDHGLVTEHYDVNPALTAMANAIRVGEHLLGRMS